MKVTTLRLHERLCEIPEFHPDGINLIFKLLPLYANEVIVCKFSLLRSANSNSISLQNLECKVGGGGNTTGEYSGILPPFYSLYIYISSSSSSR